MQMDSKGNINYKIILTGHQAVGKSSILHRITHHEFVQDYTTTIGVDFQSVNVSLFEKEITLQIWDTAGQEKFKGLTTSYFRNCQGALSVYDLSNPHTLEFAKKYVETQIQFGIQKDCIMIVGNKWDKVNENSEEMNKCLDEGKEAANELGVNFQAISAKTGENVEKLMQNLAEKLFQRHGGKIKSEHPRLKIHDESNNTCKC